jgi:hypothetical protein
MEYYVYQYMRTNGTPYYIGKGKGQRHIQKHNGGISVPKDRSKIQFIAKGLTNKDACQLEKKMISKWGRKDLGTGCLYNHTDGGESGHNRKLTEEHKSKLKKIMPMIVKKAWQKKSRRQRLSKTMKKLWNKQYDFMKRNHKRGHKLDPKTIEKIRQTKQSKNLSHPNKVNDLNRPKCKVCNERDTVSAGIRNGKRIYTTKCQRCSMAS